MQCEVGCGGGIEKWNWPGTSVSRSLASEKVCDVEWDSSVLWTRGRESEWSLTCLTNAGFESPQVEGPRKRIDGEEAWECGQSAMEKGEYCSCNCVRT